MLKEIIEAWVPVSWVPWILAIIAIGWIGWQTNTIYGMVEQHYSESHITAHYAKQTCYAVSVLAHLNPRSCEEGY